jgi:D-galactarolactone cycloisomerase
VVKIAALCQARGIEFAPHCALSGPGQVAIIHLSAAQRSPPLLEWPFCDFAATIMAQPPYPNRAGSVCAMILGPCWIPILRS